MLGNRVLVTRRETRGGLSNRPPRRGAVRSLQREVWRRRIDGSCAAYKAVGRRAHQDLPHFEYAVLAMARVGFLRVILAAAHAHTNSHLDLGSSPSRT